MRLRHALPFAVGIALLLPLSDTPLGSGGTRADAGGTQVRARAPQKISRTLFARIELGRRLFFDPAASPSGARSCASCHAPEHGWSDPGRVSADDIGDTTRHSQTIIDAAFNPTAHWDGEFSSVEQLITARLGSEPTPSGGSYGGSPFTPRDPRRPRGPVTKNGKTGKKKPVVTPGERRPLLAEIPMPIRVNPRVSTRLDSNGRYKEAFSAAFKTKSVTLPNIARAIAAFVHSVESTTAPYDHFTAGNLDALSASAQRGLKLFEGRAGCAQCHISKGNDSTGGYAFFTDFDFHNTGAAKHDLKLLMDDGDSQGALIQRVLRKHVKEAKPLRRALSSMADRGRGKVTGMPHEERKFKTPTLRDVAKRGPYMHNGRLETLHAVVRYYADGGGPDDTKSTKLHKFECSEQDADDLVAFLESLSGETQPGRASKVWTKRPRSTRLQFVDAGGRALKGLEVKLVAAGAELPVLRRPAEPIVIEKTDGSGRLRFEPGATTHTRIVLPEGLPVLGGALIPDTCAKAEVRVPVAGRMSFLVTFPAGAAAPPLLVGVHTERPQVKGHPRARTTFVRVGEVVEVKGSQVAKYEGWARTDVGHSVTLLVPGRETHERGVHIKAALRYPIAAGAEIRLDLRDE